MSNSFTGETYCAGKGTQFRFEEHILKDGNNKLVCYNITETDPEYEESPIVRQQVPTEIKKKEQRSHAKNIPYVKKLDTMMDVWIKRNILSK